MLVIDNEEIVLFQGDSITDAGRDYRNEDGLGTGYAMMAASWFSAMHPEKNVKFLNRGISGNRVTDLCARWEEDCIGIKPSLVSILIGINDCWRRFDRQDPTSVEQFESNYRVILESVQEQLKARIVLCEPFVLPYPKDREMWREDLDPKIHVVRKLAKEFEATFVPLDGIFAAAAAKRHPSFWAPDGVHPSPAGHALIAQNWLTAVSGN